MRVGVYVDGFNLYYGGVGLAGEHNVAGWRWLDIRQLAANLVARQKMWADATINRVVYCTARITANPNKPQASRDQLTYLAALRASGSVDWIEYGRYVDRVNHNPLAVRDTKGKPVIVTSQWPVCIHDTTDQEVHDASFMVSVARREEKGSDVNVVTHLLLDTLRGVIDAALVISNDSDLALPVAEARSVIPVGVINPTSNYMAGALQPPKKALNRLHWGVSLAFQDLEAAQLPALVGRRVKPVGW